MLEARLRVSPTLPPVCASLAALYGWARAPWLIALTLLSSPFGRHNGGKNEVRIDSGNRRADAMRLRR